MFAIIGVALANLFRPFGGPHLPQGRSSYVVLFGPVLVLGFLIEIAQIYLYPFYADATDLLTYSFGSWCGWTVYQFILDRKHFGTMSTDTLDSASRITVYDA